MTAPAPVPVWSGFCNVGRHHACRGLYSGHPCPCDCHQQPEAGLRIGSLFTGYGGLERGVQEVLGGTVAWLSDIDAGACKILAHRYPDVPNLGDITAIDWANVEPVDVLTGGSPCQDVSAAGKRAGMRAGTRSGLWASMCDAIEIIRPGLVVWENVRGVLSAHADSAVEPCPICVGDERDAHLRALGRVVGDLSELGYVGRWVGLRAADVGAPHGRFRVFVAAWPAADAGRLRGDAGRLAAPGQAPGGRALGGLAGRGGTHAADTAGQGLEGRRPGGPSAERSGAAGGGRGAAPHPAGDGRHQGWPESAWVVGGSDAALGGDAAADADADGNVLRLEPVSERGRNGEAVAGHAGADVAADTDPGGWGANLADLRAGQPDTHWGPYGDAVRRWERLTRPAPAPTEPGKNGPRLSPAFVEWLMGLPAGWVTDVPGLSRNEQLKALGNGVVPQQAAQALRLLLPVSARAAAA